MNNLTKYINNLNLLNKLSLNKIEKLAIKNNIPFISKEQAVDILALQYNNGYMANLREEDIDIPQMPQLIRQIEQRYWIHGVDILRNNPRVFELVVYQNDEWMYKLIKHDDNYIQQTWNNGLLVNEKIYIQDALLH